MESEMSHGRFRVPSPQNEPVLPYAPGDAQRESLKAELDRQAGEVVDVPLLINGEELRTDLRGKGYEFATETDTEGGRPHRCQLQFDEAQFSITPGQAAVFYAGEQVLGGGLIQPPEA